MTSPLSISVVPAVNNMLETLNHLCVKAAERCEAIDVAEEVYLDWRVAPDMFPLAVQFRFASEIPARALSRIAGAELPSFEDDEASFADMRARIERVKSIVAGLDLKALDADPEADITVPMGPDNMVTVPRAAFAHHWLLPNLYFHTTAAYLILRQLGVDLGKRDFLVAIARRMAQ
ncbi:MAG: hypothetical protein DHS20C05_22120 [Hyphococcus sp.]|nr:MAG: hypothetical protein DHS20C05_22120 [Marinicaulis sp.]